MRDSLNRQNQKQNKENENDTVELAQLSRLYNAGFKLLPLSINSQVVIPWTPIYENPDYWTEEKLVKEQSMFSNVATIFGSINFRDEKGQILFLNCLDCDSEYVYKILVTPINQLQVSQELYSKIQKLLCNVNITTLLEFLKQFTYIVKTRKPCGIHIYWLSQDQNNRIRTEDCRHGYEFEVKTDKGSGHSTLPPSRHRNDIDFRYHNIGRSDKIGISNELYQIFVELFSSCLHECHFNNRDVEANSKSSYNYYGIDNTLTLRSDQVNDSITLLQNCYQEGHRDIFSFQFSGLAFKQCIAEESAIAIIKGLCNYTNDPEINGRICVIQRTYSKGVNGSDISGMSGLTRVITSLEQYNEEKAKQTIQSLINIWHRYEIPLNSIVMDKVSSLTDEQLDKIKVKSQDIEFCIDTMLKEAQNEQISVRQLFVGIYSSATHLPQNIGVRTQSGAGKNYVINKVINKFPQKDITILSNMTPKALFHEHGIQVIKNHETGRYEQLDDLIDDLDTEIEENEDELRSSNDIKKKKELKATIKHLERQKKFLKAKAVKLIDLDGKVLVFLDTPDHNLLANIAPILSHDKYEQEYKFVDTSSGPKTKINVIRGFPTLIFAQASDNSNKDRHVEINRRFLSISVNTSEKKIADAVALKVEKAGGARGEYDLKVVEKSSVYQTKVILAILMRKLEKLSEPFKQQLITDNTLTLDDIESGTFIPFKESLKTGLPHKHVLDMTAAETFNTNLTLLAKINADSRPKLIYSDGVVVPIATFEDLAVAMSLLEFSNTGLNPELQIWYEDVFMTTYTQKVKEFEENNQEHQSQQDLNNLPTSLTTANLIEKHKELSIRGGGRGGYEEVNSKEILQKYLYPLINIGYIEKEDIPGRRANSYRPVKDLKYSFYSFSDEKNIFPYKLKIKIEKNELYPSKDMLELQISDSLKCSSEYTKKDGLNFKLVDENGREIEIKDLIERFYANPEDYFFLDDKSQSSSREQEQEKNIIKNTDETKILNAPLPNSSEEHFSNSDFCNNDNEKGFLNTNITKSVEEPYEKLFYEHEKEQKEYSTQSLCVIGQDKEVSKEDAVFEQIVGAIRETNGHEISVNALIESLRMKNEHGKEYFGHVAIQKDNPNVKNIYLKIIRHNNIEVVRHKPDLVVKWVKEQNTEHQLSSDYDENVYDKQHQQDSAATNAEALH